MKRTFHKRTFLVYFGGETHRGDIGTTKSGLEFNSVGIVKDVKIFLSACPNELCIIQPFFFFF